MQKRNFEKLHGYRRSDFSNIFYCNTSLYSVHTHIERHPSIAEYCKNKQEYESKVCPRANKVLIPISRAVKNVSAVYLSL